MFAPIVLLFCLASAGGDRSGGHSEPKRTPPDARAADPVLAAEAERVAMIARVSPSVVCIYDAAQRGGGSGVLIDADGNGLTNFHVVAGMIETRKGWGGLSDGKLYELEVLGVDPTGDVAMFRLTGADSFPHAVLGDSEAIRVGDTAVAMGNPFVLSEDNTPTVTRGIVTGVHRYQWGVGGNLVYTDCIQVDTAINPGNSGGPLFNDAGEVIGINGRISVSARGRLNVGFGYAISSNQVKRFIPALRAGLLARHGTLRATVDEIEGGRAAFDNVTADGAAFRAGVRVGDRLLSFDGAPIATRNQYASILGTYPADWPVVLRIERAGELRIFDLRLDPVNPSLSAPFAVNREVNLRQVRRVLTEYQKAVTAGGRVALPGQWGWSSVRSYMPDPDRRERPREHYSVTFDGGGPARMRRQYGDGSQGSLIAYDDAGATQRVSDGEEALELPTDVKMVLGALYVMQRRMLSPVEELDLTNVGHGGADAIRMPPSPRPDLQRLVADDRQTTVLEVLDWPIAGQIAAKFSFDTQTGRLHRIRVRDVPTGVEAEILITDYAEVEGLRWPGGLTVRGPGYEYTEAWSGWKLGT